MIRTGHALLSDGLRIFVGGRGRVVIVAASQLDAFASSPFRVRSLLRYASEVTRLPLLDVYDDDDEAEDGR